MTGLVSIVGAGPGDPDLITVGALERLKAADVVLYDRLVDRRLLDRARPGAELIDVGKSPGGRGRKQADINSLLIDRARNGKSVVRLKGGDPFVFGRGGEEADALRAGGIPFEVLSGVSSAIAAPAYAGIPVTHRGLASSLTIVTGSEAPGKPDSEVDWEALAAGKGTLVVMMGWQNIEVIVGALLRYGRPPDTPVALVSQGTTPDQRAVVGTLGDIVDRAAGEDIGPPVVAVIGDVVTLRDHLAWFDKRPLFGKRVLVTRTREQAGELSSLLSRQGAVPIELPTIEVMTPRRLCSSGPGTRRPGTIRLGRICQRKRGRRRLRKAGDHGTGQPGVRWSEGGRSWANDRGEAARPWNRARSRTFRLFCQGLGGRVRRSGHEERQGASSPGRHRPRHPD